MSSNNCNHAAQNGAAEATATTDLAQSAAITTQNNAAPVQNTTIAATTPSAAHNSNAAAQNAADLTRQIRQNGFDYSFDPHACKGCGGRCCTGESGYIWASEAEISALAAYFKMGEAAFKKQFCEPVGVRFSLAEVPFEGGFACVFFDQQKRQCSVYDLRPKQCRTYPFWDYFKRHFDELKAECAGVQRECAGTKQA